MRVQLSSLCRGAALLALATSSCATGLPAAGGPMPATADHPASAVSATYDCPAVRVVDPIEGATFAAADDLDQDCSNGIQHDVRIETEAPDGAMLVLWIDGRIGARAVVARGEARFTAVNLGASGRATFEVRQEQGEGACAQRSVGLECRVPACAITRPAGDILTPRENLSAEPGRFVIAVDVATDMADGSSVQLEMTGADDLVRTTSNRGLAKLEAPLATDSSTTLRARCEDAWGNVTWSSPRVVRVDNSPLGPPAVAFVAPTSGSAVTAVGDGDPEALGYQGAEVVIETDAVVGSSVELSVNDAVVARSAVAGRRVTFTGVDLPEADWISLRAVVHSAQQPDGEATSLVLVDTRSPTAVGDLSVASSPISGAVELRWSSAGDAVPDGSHMRPVANYEIRYSMAPIDEGNFERATPSAYTLTPGVFGQMQAVSVTGLGLGSTYWFAVRAYDRAGNHGPLSVTSDSVKLAF